ncbi:MAG: hypothetical protein ACRCST_00820 [Turicibacter sp.]
MIKKNHILCITKDNQTYEGEVYHPQTQLLKSSLSQPLSDAQVLSRYFAFIQRNKEWAGEYGQVITLKIHETYLELTYEPLKICDSFEIQGEMPIELYIRFGKNLPINDWNQLNLQLKKGVFGNLYAC